MKVFISQPMKDKTEKEIVDQRKRIEDYIRGEVNEDVEIIDSYVQDAPDECNPVFFLGLSLQFLSQADLAVFAQGYENARGCVIEREVCNKYGIPAVTVLEGSDQNG
jgi:hypothetical protein